MKKNNLIGIVLSLVLIGGLIAGTFPVAPTAAADLIPTTSLTITKYAADGTTIIDQTVVGYDWMAANLPPQGDGMTHYFMQGPTLDPSNLWDPDETVNLKDKGAVMGTDVKDLCNLVDGGAAAGDEIKLHCSDGYNETFQYENVYTPSDEQGPMVICWYTKDAGDSVPQLYPDGAFVPDFAEGMQLVFMPDDHVFGNQNMKDCLPEDNWHYYTEGSIQYPSVNGLSLKCIDAIDIYEGGTTEWELELYGAQDYTMTQTEFENGVACEHSVTYTDASGTWEGMPLWLLCGWVDDNVQHGPGAFNDTLASAGYQIKVSASDGYSYTFDSADVARNDNIIVANTLDGSPLPVDKYPLKLVGSALVSGGQKVGQITKIELLNLPTIEEWELDLVGMGHYLMSQSEFESGVACEHGVTYTDASGTWSGIPLWLLCGWVDDDVQHGEGAFNDDMAAAGYGVKVTAIDGFSYTFDSTLVARNDGIIVANTLDGSPLPQTGDKPTYPLKLVGPALTSGKQKVGQIASIELIIPWNLELSGASDYVMPNTEFEDGVAANGVSWNDTGKGELWQGLALWRLAGMVDDDDPTTFNDAMAAIGYSINVIASDGYTKTFTSTDIARNDNIIVANTLNGYPLPADKFPLRLVGPSLSGSQKVSQIVRIELVNLPTLMEFSVGHMYINFTWLRPHTQDTIIASGSFSLPEGASYDLASDDVAMNIDGVNITIPAGSFKKWLPRREIYTYTSPPKSSPCVWMSLNFGTGEWSLLVRDVDASAVDNSDGVAVKLSIGPMVGAESIGMHIDSLSY